MAAGSGYDISASISGSSSAATGAITNTFAPVTIGTGMGGSSSGSGTSWSNYAIIGVVALVLFLFLNRKKH
jgi:hypothetical protein